MASLSFLLKEIGTRVELACWLGIGVCVVDLVSILSTPCSSAGCPLPAIKNNKNDKCFLCSQSWFPREFTASGTRLRLCRGYGLFGPEFLQTEDLEKNGGEGKGRIGAWRGAGEFGGEALPRDR